MDLELDQFRDVDLVIDRANDSFVQKQFVSQGDYKGRTLTVQVTNNGNVGEVPGLTLNLNWHNEASGLTDLTAFSVVNKAASVFTIEYPEHMMTPCKVYAIIQIIQNGKVTNLKQFELTVQRLAGEAVGIIEKAEYSALVAVLADSNKFRTDIDDLSLNKAEKEDLESLATYQYVNDKLAEVGEIKLTDTVSTYSDLISKYPSGTTGIVVVKETGKWYTWSGNAWVVGGDFIPTIGENTVTQPMLDENVVSENKLSAELQRQLTQLNESIDYFSDKKYFKSISSGSVSTTDGALRVDYTGLSLNPDKFEQIMINQQVITTVLQDESVSNGIKTSWYKRVPYRDLVDVSTAFQFGTTENSFRIQMNMKQMSIVPGNATRGAYSDVSYLDAKRQNDFSNGGNYVGIHGNGRFEVSITKSKLSELGFTESTEGAIAFCKSLSGNIYVRQSGSYEVTLPPFLIKKGETISVSTINQLFSPQIVLYSDKANAGELPIIVYRTEITNNLEADRSDEIAKVKVLFDNFEARDTDYLRVYVENVEVPFEWLGNLSDQPTGFLEQERYPNGFLKAGEIAFNVTLTSLQTKSVRIEVYNQPQLYTFNEQISFANTSTNTYKLTLADKVSTFYANQLFGLKEITDGINYVGVAGNTIERAIIVNPSGSTGLSIVGEPDIEIYGDGIVYRRFLIRHKTNMNGVTYVNRIDVLSDGRIETEKSIVFDDTSKLAEIPLRINLSATLNSNSTAKDIHTSEYKQAQYTTFGNSKFVQTIVNVQGAAQGAGDGHNGTKNSYGQVTVSSNGALSVLAVFLSDYDFVPKNGDYWSTKSIFQVTNEEIELTQLKHLNPLTATATKKKKREIKQLLKENMLTYLDNIFDEFQMIEPFWGASVLVRQVYYDMNGEYLSKKQEIQTKFDDFKNKYTDAATIWDLYVNGGGLAYTARDGHALHGMYQMFIKYGDTTNANECLRLIDEFAKFYIKIEEYAGSNGKVYLDYANKNDVLNAEAAAMAGLLQSIKMTGNVTEAQAVYERIETHFLSQIAHRNILPYSSEFDVRADYRGHYHLFSLYDYLSLNENDINFDVFSHISNFTNSLGKIEEMRFDCQPSRRGDYHTILYAIGIALKTNAVNELALSELMLRNVNINLLPSGGKIMPIDQWIQGDVTTHNIKIEAQLICEMILGPLSTF